MARKTLKQKLKSQNRILKSLAIHQQTVLSQEHELAGYTINHESQKVQAIALAHGIMATLIEAKKNFDIESDAFKALEKVSQARIAQCLVQLIQMGIPAEEANKRIMAGH